MLLYIHNNYRNEVDHALSIFMFPMPRTMEFDKKNAFYDVETVNITEEIPGYLSEFPSFSTHIEKDHL